MAEIGFGFPSNSGIPIGVVLPFFGADSDVPDGWLLCDGRKFSVGRYAALAAQLSRATGVYTDTTPDLRGRAPVGKDNMGGVVANIITAAWADSVGGIGGAETHTLTTAELAVHDHVEQVANTTNPQTAEAAKKAAAAGGAASNVLQNSNNPNGNGTVVDISTQTSGSGNAHNNMQPSIAMNYIIKAA